MNERTQDRLFAGCGIASVVLGIAGALIGSAGGSIISLTLSSTPAQVASAVAKPAGSLVWVGAYIQLLGYGPFLAFVVWAAAKLGGGLLGQVARAAGTGYAILGIASLCVLDAIEYRAGHGMGVQLATALHTLNEALFVGAWFLSVFFLLAAGALALTSGRRALGWSANGVALVTLVATALAVDIVGPMLWLGWIVYASIALARGDQARAAAVALARSS